MLPLTTPVEIHEATEIDLAREGDHHPTPRRRGAATIVALLLVIGLIVVALLAAGSGGPPEVDQPSDDSVAMISSLF